MICDLRSCKRYLKPCTCVYALLHGAIRFCQNRRVTLTCKSLSVTRRMRQPCMELHLCFVFLFI